MNETIKQALLQRRAAVETPVGHPVAFNTGNPDSEQLLKDLAKHPHAFVLACIMDRQATTERAWVIPHLLRDRLGTFQFVALADFSLQRLTEVFATPSPLHRFPEVMPKNAHAAFQWIRSQHGGDASRIWSDCPSSALLVLRFLEFEGVAPKIATMAANILVRDFKVPVSDKYSLDISADVQVQRVFERLGLTREGASNEELIYTARPINPDYPGIFDLAAWDIGRSWCLPKDPECVHCRLSSVCPSSDATA